MTKFGTAVRARGPPRVRGPPGDAASRAGRRCAAGMADRLQVLPELDDLFAQPPLVQADKL